MKKLVVNQAAFNYAKELIQRGQVNTAVDNWMDHCPDAESENKYLAGHSFAEYGLWFLALDKDANDDTKDKYEFPVGDFQQIYRSGVIAAEKRAAQFGHAEVERAAKDLLALIDGR